jgi:hypothetical protein
MTHIWRTIHAALPPQASQGGAVMCSCAVRADQDPQITEALLNSMPGDARDALRRRITDSDAAKQPAQPQPAAKAP